jgi:CubicO group peptidase (beta-lactamase class C family)
MSKSVTNALVGILVKDQVLDIHAKAPVDDWKTQGDPRNEITLDMMLRMSSGLEFEEVYGPFKDATNMLYANRSMADFASAKPLAYTPDTHWSYASGTTNLIARIIKDKVGGSLADFHKFSRERLFNKIKAYSAVIEPDASGSFVGSSYMFATARDWARFGLFLKNDGVWEKERLLPEGWVAYSTHPTPGASQGQYGAQFWLNAGDRENPMNRKFPTLPRDLYYCGGFNGQIVAVIPSRDLVVVRLGVTHDDSWDHETFIGQILDAIRI